MPLVVNARRMLPDDCHGKRRFTDRGAEDYTLTYQQAELMNIGQGCRQMLYPCPFVLFVQIFLCRCKHQFNTV